MRIRFEAFVFLACVCLSATSLANETPVADQDQGDVASSLETDPSLSPQGQISTSQPRPTVLERKLESFSASYNVVARSLQIAEPGAFGPENLNLTLHLLGARAALMDRLAVAVTGSYVDTNLRVRTRGGTQDESVRGFGDVRMQVIGTLLRDSVHLMELSGGAALPTGSTSETDSRGRTHAPPYQPGAGTASALASLNYRFSYNRWMAGSALEALTRVGRSSEGYRLGDEYTARLYGSYFVLPFLVPTVSLSYRQKDRLEGYQPAIPTAAQGRPTQPPSRPSVAASAAPQIVDPLALGSTDWQATMGVRSFIPLGHPALRATVEAGVPVWQDGPGSGPALKTRWYLMSAVSASF